MSNNFEANFSGTGTPIIKIYKVVGGEYTLEKTDDMVATPETGKFSYEYKQLNQFSDYSARMELGCEQQNAVYNGIFSEIFAKAGTGGGGGNFRMTKAELDRIVAEMGLLFQDALSKVEVSLPDGLGESEIAAAVLKVKNAGIQGVEKINEISKIHEESVRKFSLQLEEKGLDSKDLDEKLDRIIGAQNDITESMKDAIIKEISENISGKEDQFKKFASLLAVFRKEQQREMRQFARLIDTFRKELKK